MKLLLINTNSTSYNGVTNAIFNLLEAMEGKNIDIDYLSINDPEDKYKRIIKNKWGNLYVFPRNTRPIKYFFELSRLIKNNKYDIVHVHGNSHTLSLEMLAAKIAGCKIRIAHGQNSTCYNLKLHKILTPIFNATCNYGFACSQNAGDFLFGEKEFIVLRNGINMKKYAFDIEKREEIRKRLGYTNNCIVVGNVAAMRKEKNQLFLIDVFNYLYRNNNNYRMILVGDGPDRTEIEENITELGLNDVIHLTGFADDSIYLSAMDMIVMPSVFEGLPISLIEEQTNGLVCFVSENITKEIDTTKKNIFISLDRKPEEWAEIIANANILRTEDLSEEFFKKTKEAGFDIYDESEWIFEYYDKVIKENKLDNMERKGNDR